MKESLQGSPNNTDDLDLLSLLEKIIRFFRKYTLMLALFSMIGAIIGFSAYKFLPKRYSSSLLLHSFTLTNTEQINIIANWNELLKNKEYTILGNLLNCSPSLVSQIDEIKSEEIQKVFSENNPNGFNVEVIVKDNNSLDSLQLGIIYGLENSDYMKTRLATKRSGLIQLTEKLRIEINKLDSTKKSIEFNINNNTQHASSYMLDISGINTQMIILNEKLLTYQEQLKFTAAVQVLHKFEKFSKPASPKFFKSIILGLIAGFAIGYLIAIYSTVKRMLSMRRS